MTNQLQDSSADKKDSVLIVDDDAFMLKVLHRVLEKDYTLYQAGSAEEAAEVLRGRNIRVVFCDHVLPKQSGLDFLTALHKKDKRIKSVLFSAALETKPFIEAINRGEIFRFIKKPASPADIANAVRAAVRQCDIEELQEQVLADRKNIDRKMYNSAAPYWLYRLRVIARQSFRYSAPLFGNALSLILAMGVVILTIGICIMLIIYFVENQLGIDIFGQNHPF